VKRQDYHRDYRSLRDVERKAAHGRDRRVLVRKRTHNERYHSLARQPEDAHGGLNPAREPKKEPRMPQQRHPDIDGHHDPEQHKGRPERFDETVFDCLRNHCIYQTASLSGIAYVLSAKSRRDTK